MKILVPCPNVGCHAEYRLEASLVGRMVECIDCGHKFVIPAAGPGAEPVEEKSGPSSLALLVPSALAPWRPGNTVAGVYEVKDIIAKARRHQTCHVRHRNWDTELAVKVMKKAVFTNKEAQTAFMDGLWDWVRLRYYPHVVSCYYVRPLGGVPCVFMEYAEGENVQDMIRTKALYAGNVSAATARILDIAIQAAWGLWHAHKREVVHGDVKPGNIIVAANGLARITDFCMARARRLAGEKALPPAALGSLKPAQMTVSQGGVTPAYAAPEQLVGLAPDAASDIWSLAMSMIHMFTGQISWSAGGGGLAVLDACLERGASSSRRQGVAPGIPQALAAPLARCLDKARNNRPQNLSELVNAMQQCYRDLTGVRYPRTEPVRTVTRPDALNNQALAMLDVAKNQDAEFLLREALRMNPEHAQASANLAVLRWWNGKTTDDALLDEFKVILEAHPESWDLLQLQVRLQLERGDREAATAALASAGRFAATQKYAELSRELESLRHAGCLRQLAGAQEDAAGVDLAADGRLGVSGGGDGVLRLWNLDSGACEREIAIGARGLAAVGINADGNLAAAGGRDGSLHVFDLRTGEKLGNFAGHGRSVSAVSFSADGKVLVSGSKEGTLRVWNVATGACLNRIEAHGMGVTGMCVSADGGVIVSASADMSVVARDAETGGVLKMFAGHTSVASSVAMTPDGRWIVSGGWDATVRFWEMESGRCMRVLKGHGNAVTTVAVTPDARWLVSGSMDNTIRVWDIPSGRCVRTFAEHAAPVVALEIAGSRLFSAGADGVLRVWDLEAILLREAQMQHPPVAFCPRRGGAGGAENRDPQAQNLLAQAMESLEAGNHAQAMTLVKQARALPGQRFSAEAMALWSALSEGAERSALKGADCLVQLREHTGSVTGIAVSRTGEIMLSSGNDKTLRLWDVAAARCLKVLEGHTEAVTSVSMSADARWAASGSEDGDVRIWDLNGRRGTRTFREHKKPVVAVSMSPDGRLVASGGDDQNIRIWDLAAGREAGVLHGHGASVTAVELSPDGQMLVSGSHDSSVRVWALDNGRCLRKLTHHKSFVTSAGFIPGTSLIFSAGYDNLVIISDWKTGREVARLVGHTGFVEAACISPDGKWLASGSCDNTIRLWELASGKCLRILAGHQSFVMSLAFSGDGQYLFSGGMDKAINLWELDWDLTPRP